MKSFKSRRLTAIPFQTTVRSGFTLVEMLVSTALVILIMTLFAQIYGAAVGTLREQEGIAKNDSKARSVVTMLRNDLSVRSFREIPLAVSDPNKAALVARGLVPIHPRCPDISDAQKGYFYISENDPGNDTDDLLSFTLFLRQEIGHFTGRVAIDGSSRINHPDSDDAVQDDGVTSSRAAVVTYFLQNGKLHRRINLLRDPLVIPNPYSAGDAGAGALTWLPVQPSDEAIANEIGLGNLIFPNPTPAVWYQDNALAITENAPPITVSSTPRQRLLTVRSLENWHRFSNAPAALPLFREGHVAPSGNPTGEFSGTTFIGRTPLSGNRLGEDVVLSNVIGFDIKVWEPQDANLNGVNGDPDLEGGQRGGRFVDLGHGNLTDADKRGPFAESPPPPVGMSSTSPNSTWGINPASTYGPGGPSGNRTFDTWHPLAPTGNFPSSPPTLPLPPSYTPESISPPFYPLKISPDKSTASVSWSPNASITTAGTDWTAHQVFFPWAFRGDYSIGFRATNSGTTGLIQPVWSRIPGDRVLDGTLVWECFDNRIGLTAMRITIRFIDPGSSLIRQVTLDQSFLD